MNSESDLTGVETLHELTGTQTGILYQCLLAANSPVYQNQIKLAIQGQFSPQLFVLAVNDVIERHQPLRSIYLHEGLDQPATIVKSEALLPVEYLVMNNASESELQRIASQKAVTPIPMDKAPLMRLTSIELNHEYFYLILDFHHIVFDGWSNAIIFNEISYCYRARLLGITQELPTPSLYGDYVKSLASVDQSNAIAHWKHKLKGLIQPTLLPLSKSPSSKVNNIDYANANYEFRLDKNVSQRLGDAAKAHRVTLNTLIAAAWALVVSRYADSEEVVFGITVNGRSNVLPLHEQTVGLFVNTVPLRITLKQDANINDYLVYVQHELVELTQFEQVPMSTIHKNSEFETGVELFETLLVFQSFPIFTINDDLPGNTKLPWHYNNVKVHENSPLPLTIEVFDHETISFLAMFNDSRISSTSVEQLIKHLNAVLRQIANTADSTQCINQIPMLSSLEIRTESVDFRQQLSKDKLPATLMDVFHAQAKKTPYAMAVSDKATSLTYSALTTQTNLMAKRLQHLGIGAGDRVLIYAQRCCQIYPALLGIMELGAVFVPMDSRWPVQRINDLAENCNAKLVLTDDLTHNHRSQIGLPVVQLGDYMLDKAVYEQQPPLATSAIFAKGKHHENIAYIIYTSGSTGTPKGVLGTHSATLNRFFWMWHQFPFQDNDKCVQKTPLCFVDSIWELFGPLLRGVHTHIIDDELVKLPQKMLDHLQSEKITHLVVVPSYLSALLDECENVGEKLAHLRLCTVSGETLPERVANSFLEKAPNCTLLNLYGTTEVAADVCWSQMDSPHNVRTGNIGGAIHGVATHILSSSLLPMPPGAIGELCISGVAVSAGYIHQSNAEAHAFIDNPFSDGYLHRTGDLASRNADGTIQLHGRKDNTVKINGIRIDPAEITAAITRHPNISYATASVDNSRKIHCWYRSITNQPIDQDTLKTLLGKRLPAWMIPTSINFIDRFPRLATGKIDSEALLATVSPQPIAVNERRLPSSSIEKALASIWQALLPHSEPHLDALFIESGGDSIAAMRFNARVQREFGRTIAPRLLLVANLEQLALSLEPKCIDDGNSHATNDQPPDKPNSIIEPLMFESGQQMLYGVLHRANTDNDKPAALICSSVGHEYMKLHRLQHTIATLLSANGCNVLRFDYTGMGNSSGTTDAVSVTNWISDIQAAASTLLKQTNKNKLIIVASRLGVPLLLKAKLKNIAEIVAVDTIYDGSYFVDHLKELHQYALDDTDRFHQRPTQSQPYERFGYTYSETLLGDIKELSVTADKVPAGIRFNLLQSGMPTANDGSGYDTGTLNSKDTNTSRFSPQTLRTSMPVWSEFRHGQTLIMDHALAEQIAAVVTKAIDHFTDKGKNNT